MGHHPTVAAAHPLRPLLPAADISQQHRAFVDVEVDIELGDRSTIVASMGLVAIDWLGQRIDAVVHITADQATGRATRPDGAPIGLLGTSLLKNAVVTLDFPRASLRVRAEADE